MEQIVAEENMENPSNQMMTEQSSRPRKGGFRTMPFIIVNESFEKVASYGLMPNMIFYLMNVYHMETVNGTTILFMWSAISNALAIVGAFLSDSFLGRFWVITLGSFCSLLGMTLLWLTAMIPQLKPPPCAQFSSNCDSATPGQLFVLLSSFGLISIGAGCIRPCSIAFGADQLDKKNNPNNERLLESFFNWYYTSIGVSTVLALTIIVYIQDHLGWKVGFAVPAILMAVSALMFLFGSSLYAKVKAEKSLFTGFIQVLVAALRKRRLPLSAESVEYHYGKDSNFIVPTDKLRCLNRACIVRDPQKDLNPDGSAVNPWSLCTIDQVESLKALLRVIPMWSTGIMILISMNQHSFSTLQANMMDRNLNSKFQIPAGSFAVFTIVTLTIWVVIYDRAIVPLLVKYTGNQRGLGTKTRMGIGLVLSALAMAMSAIVENIRRKVAIDQGLVDKPRTVMDMSAMWLIPQYCLFGLAEAFNAIGQIEFYFSQFPRNMSSIAMALFTLGMAVANLVGTLLVRIVDRATKKGGNESWLSRNLNKGHLDYYYWLLTIMCVANFVYFLVCCWAYGPSEDIRAKMKDQRLGQKASKEDVSKTTRKT
uniref:Major facilitator superfamily (MFS) profile domain-containing protein n=1 Tax=Fagus sylvatica TaxID=28930 RepID=A0A2N9H1W9_FAGSY